MHRTQFSKVGGLHVNIHALPLVNKGSSGLAISMTLFCLISQIVLYISFKSSGISEIFWMEPLAHDFVSNRISPKPSHD